MHVIFLSLLALLQVSNPEWHISKDESNDVFICRSLVENAYVNNQIHPFSLPIPSSAKKVSIGGRRIVIDYPKKSSITIYPKPQERALDTSLTYYSQGEAMLYDTWFSVQNKQLRAKIVTILIKSNIGDIRVSCPPGRLGFMLSPLLDKSIRDILDGQTLIAITSSNQGFTLFLPQTDENNQEIRIPPNCKAMHYIDDSHMVFMLDRNQYVSFSKNIGQTQLFDELNRYPIYIKKKRYHYYIQEQGDYLVTYFIMDNY